jgi:hypothetical protein
MNEGAVVLISFRYRIFNVADSERTARRAPDTRPGGAADCSASFVPDATARTLDSHPTISNNRRRR